MNTIVPKNDVTLTLGDFSLAANGTHATIITVSSVALLAILLLKVLR